MKKTTIALLTLLIAAVPAFAQNQFEVSTDKDGGKILKGILSRDLIEKDTAFYNTWYAANFKAYAPNADAVNGLKIHKDSLQLLVFMGTWCEDSHFIIPKLFHLSDAADFPSDKISILGTDRAKKTLGHLSETMGVTNVPTIIVMKKGKEVGRIVEYGKYGQFDKELAEILNSVK